MTAGAKDPPVGGKPNNESEHCIRGPEFGRKAAAGVGVAGARSQRIGGGAGGGWRRQFGVRPRIADDQNALKAALIEARAKLSGAEALIRAPAIVIAKMKRELFGPRSERSRRLLDQLELQLEELAAAAGEEEAKAETAGSTVQGFLRRKTRRNLPDHLLRRRIVHPAPACYFLIAVGGVTHRNLFLEDPVKLPFLATGF